MGETPKRVSLTLDGRGIEVPAGTLLIEACKSIGIEVPSFCYYPRLSLQAACRMCLVEIEKAPKLQTACTVVVQPGMVVRTDTPPVREARRSMLEFLLSNHPLDCPVCDKGGECELQDMTFRYGAASSRFQEEKEHQPEQRFSPLVYFDYPRCILCFRCVRVCDEGMDVKALGVGQRGVHSVILPNQADGTLECEECGMCIDICPVGALTSDPYRYRTRPWEMTFVSTSCAHCGDGCKTTLNVRQGEILRGNNRDQSGLNGDFLCIKGRYGSDFVRHPERLQQPLRRRNGRLEPTSWEEALRLVAGRLEKIRTGPGPESIGFLGSNRTTNEENYLLQRLARGVLGTANLDHHRTADFAALAAALYREPEGYAASRELLRTPAVLWIGGDPTHNHPLLAWNLRTGVRLEGTRLYLLHSREIKLRRQARQVVLIPPGQEAEAIQALHTGQANLPPETLAALTHLRAALEKEPERIIVFGAEVWGPSVSELVRFGHRLPGRTRYLALGDYANSRGAADMGLLPDRLPGYAPVQDSAARERWQELWKTSLPAEPGLDARQMLAGSALRALYVVGTNPFETFARGQDLDRPSGLDLLVVQELFLTPTAEQADVVLPAACAYEKEGTFTNTCGEAQRLKRAVEAPGAARTDFEILRLLSHALGQPLPLRTPEAAWEEIRQHVRGYQIPLAPLLAGEAVPTKPIAESLPRPTPPGLVFSSDDSLFTSGTLGRYSATLNRVPERNLPRSRL